MVVIIVLMNAIQGKNYLYVKSDKKVIIKLNNNDDFFNFKVIKQD